MAEINNKENYAREKFSWKIKIYKVFSRVDRTQQAAGVGDFSGNLLKLYWTFQRGATRPPLSSNEIQMKRAFFHVINFY